MLVYFYRKRVKETDQVIRESKKSQHSPAKGLEREPHHKIHSQYSQKNLSTSRSSASNHHSSDKLSKKQEKEEYYHQKYENYNQLFNKFRAIIRQSQARKPSDHKPEALRLPILTDSSPSDRQLMLNQFSDLSARSKLSGKSKPAGSLPAQERQDPKSKTNRVQTPLSNFSFGVQSQRQFFYNFSVKGQAPQTPTYSLKISKGNKS